jgi:hypothetical protein
MPKRTNEVILMLGELEKIETPPRKNSPKPWQIALQFGWPDSYGNNFSVHKQLELKITKMKNLHSDNEQNNIMMTSVKNQ